MAFPKHKCADGKMRSKPKEHCPICQRAAELEGEPPAAQALAHGPVTISEEVALGSVTVLDKVQLDAIVETPEGTTWQGRVTESHPCCDGSGCALCNPGLIPASTQTAAEIAADTAKYPGTREERERLARAGQTVTDASAGQPVDEGRTLEQQLGDLAEHAVEGEQPPLLGSIMLGFEFRRGEPDGLGIRAIDVVDIQPRTHDYRPAGVPMAQALEDLEAPKLASLNFDAMDHRTALNMGLAIALRALRRYDADTQPELQYPKQTPALNAPEYKDLVRRLANHGLI